jgi:ribosomal protein S4
LPASARARPQNWTKPRSYISKKLAIEREKQQKQLRKRALKKLQRWLDNKPKLLRMRSSYGSVRRKLPNGHLKSSNNKLQPLKKVAIQQISVSEKPYTNQQKD